MDERYKYPALSPYQTGLSSRCPRCGQGRLFEGFLTVPERCAACKLDYSVFDPADGPAIFIMMIVGFVVVGGALVVEVAFHPPLWVHALLWLPMTLILSLAMLRPFKGVLIALQYKHQAAEGRLVDTDAA